MPEPKDDRMIPIYPKARVYAELGKEFSIEELRAIRYLNKTDEPNKVEVIPIEDDEVVESIIKLTPDKMEQNLIFKLSPEQIPSSSHSIDKHHNSRDLVTKVKTSSSVIAKLQLWSPEPVKRKELSTRDKISSEMFNSNPVKSKKMLISETQGDTSSNTKSLDFNLWNSLTHSPEVVCKPAKKVASKFAIYEQSTLVIQEEMGPKGKTFLSFIIRKMLAFCT